MIIFCDLDGTLCKDLHRRSWAFQKQWDIYHGLCSLDKAYEDILTLLYNWAVENHTIILITGRNERYRDVTVEWLRKYGVPFDALHMRPADDTICPTVALKYGWIQGYDLTEQAHLVLENDPVQAAMLNDHGLTVWNILRGEDDEREARDH